MEQEQVILHSFTSHKKSISSSYENHNVGINIWGHFQPWAGFIDKWDQNSFIYSLFSDFCSNFSFFIIYRHSVGLVLHFQNTLPITHLDLLESGFLFKRRIARTSILSEDRGSHLLKRIIIKHKICAKGNIFKQIFTKMNYFEQIWPKKQK